MVRHEEQPHETKKRRREDRENSRHGDWETRGYRWDIELSSRTNARDLRFLGCGRNDKRAVDGVFPLSRHSLSREDLSKRLMSQYRTHVVPEVFLLSHQKPTERSDIFQPVKT